MNARCVNRITSHYGEFSLSGVACFHTNYCVYVQRESHYWLPHSKLLDRLVFPSDAVFRFQIDFLFYFSFKVKNILLFLAFGEVKLETVALCSISLVVWFHICLFMARSYLSSCSHACLLLSDLIVFLLHNIYLYIPYVGGILWFWIILHTIL